MTSLNSKWSAKDTAQGLLFVNFNQDFSYFSIGTDNGFSVYSINPFKESIKRIHSISQEPLENSTISSNSSNIITQGEKGGFGIVEMLYKTNIIALVGGGLIPKFQTNR